MRKPGLVLALVLVARGAVAQSESRPAAAVDSAVITPIGERYAGGWLRRALLGSEYRALWATPVTVPVLDLASYGGGLTPVSRGGGQQTTSLRLRAADGREFYFRSIDKDPTPNLPPELVGTVIAEVVQDQVSSAHPTAPLIVAPLLAAAGVLHGAPELYILPDDERLGEHRGDLAGLIGMLEPRIAAGWGGASEVITGDELFARIERGPDDRVDARALLKARLVDILVGDWDRHRDQWSWVRFGEEVPRRWQPVPRDRDFAMIRYDGLLLRIARINLPQLIDFGPEYPDILGLTWNGRELDRYLLSGLERPAWDSVTAELQAALTDEVIGDAVRRLPAEHYALAGAAITSALLRRRDALPLVADRFYRMLAEQVDILATDADELAEVTPLGDGALEVSLRRRGDSAAEPQYRRRFRRAETREVRLFLRGGRDSAAVAGGRDEGIRVRVIGGPGDDALGVAPGAGSIRMYDVDPGTRVGRGAALDRRPYTPPPKRHATEIPARDWGRRWQPAGLIAAGPDLGVLIGVGRTLTLYGFRKLPFSSRHRFRAGIATGPWTYRADYLGQFRRENSPASAEVRLRASGIEVLRFHGFGNEQPADRSREYYRVTQQEFALDLSLVRPVGRHLEFSLGPTARFVATDDRPDRFLATLDPYGDGGFGQVGGRASISIESRSRPSPVADGVRLMIGGSAYPAWWDVAEAYGELHAEAVSVLSLHAPLAPSLHLRVGGKRIWGRAPYFDAAFIGSATTVRLGAENRYAGDAAAWANSELHLALGEVFIGAPMQIGLLGLADVGRVFLEGEDSDKWHGAAGGGLWLSILDRANTIRVAVARGEERTAVYFQAGFGF